MTELLLMRHGQTEENRLHILQGRMPGHLTEQGREQARQTALTLLSAPPAAIVCSDLQRCRDTAAIVLSTLQGHRPSHAASEAKQPADNAAASASGCQQSAGQAAVPPTILYTKLLSERDWGSITGQTVDATHRVVIPPDAETPAELRRRAATFLRFAADTYPGQRVLVVSHGLFLRFMQAVHHGVEISEVKPMTNGEIRTLTCE